MENTNYILKDHLGSINYILDDEGNVEQELNFDAWGRRRNPVTWEYYESAATLPIPMFERGFTIHEHLDAFKLINMNGRMYDPVVARFLSPDPIIQAPEYSHNYNSYSYVLNNPLRFTDPSGFMIDWFQNEETGNIFYNNSYTKEDAGRIEGDGWVWLGENGMFREDESEDAITSDLRVLNKNINLIDIKGSEIMTITSEGAIEAFNVEVSLKGKNAVVFMYGQGYNLLPTQQTIYEKTMDSWAPGPGSHSFTIITGRVITITEKSQYLKNSNKAIGQIQLTGIKTDPKSFPFVTSVSRYEITYTDNWFLKAVSTTLSLSKQLGGTHDMRNRKNYSTWSQYSGHIKLINGFRKEYGRR